MGRGDGGRRAEDPEASLVCLADVEPEEVRFLWRPRVPLGKLTILEGDPGQGKSFLTAALAAAVSRGDALPGADAFEPRNVLMLTAEDGLGDTLRPRLDSLEADVDRIFACPDLRNLAERKHREWIEDRVQEHEALLTVIDPISAYLGPTTDTHRDNQVRSVLAPLAQIAERTGAAVMVVRHLSKAQQSRAIYRGLGSIGFTATARSVLLAGASAEDPEEKALLHIKSNIAKKAAGLGYRILEETGAARFEWTGESELTPQDLLSEERRSAGFGKIEEAREFLRETLDDGPVPATEVRQQAKEADIKMRTLDEAKRREGIRSSKRGFEGGHWCWFYPAEEVGEHAK